MVYGILRMINFAHGEIFMAGAFAGFFAAVGLGEHGFLNASPLLSLLSIVVMIRRGRRSRPRSSPCVERIAYRPLRNAPRWCR